MAYRIDYEDPQKHNCNPGVLPRIVLTGILFAFFLLGVTLFWPQGREVLRLLLIPGSPDATIEAAETFVSELSCGSGLRTAATDFFRNMAGYEIFP